MSLLTRRRMMSANQSGGEKWDYEWYASSAAPPPDSTYSSFEASNGFALIRGLILQFDIRTPDFCIIEAKLDHLGAATVNSPQISLKFSSGIGAKMVVNGHKKIAVYGMTLLKNVNVAVTAGFHTYTVIFDNGTFTALYDGEEVASGSGRAAPSYDVNGFFASYLESASGIYMYDYIKYRYGRG